MDAKKTSRINVNWFIYDLLTNILKRAESIALYEYLEFHVVYYCIIWVNNYAVNKKLYQYFIVFRNLKRIFAANIICYE